MISKSSGKSPAAARIAGGTIRGNAATRLRDGADRPGAISNMRKQDKAGLVKDAPGGVAAVGRALSILDAFRDSDGQLSLAAIASRTHLYKSTILRLIISLEQYGYLRRLDNGDYQLGPKLSELSVVYQGSFRLETFVLPVLREVVVLSRESASFYVRDRDKRICLFRIDSPQAVRDHVRVGDVLPLDKGAGGKILSRFERGANVAKRAAAEDFVIATFGERQGDTAAVAAPVFGADGQLIGALSISGPRVRFDKAAVSRFSAAVLAAATSLSTTLGAAPDLFPRVNAGTAKLAATDHPGGSRRNDDVGKPARP